MTGTKLISTYPAKLLDLCNVFGKDRRLLALVKTIKLGDIVHLHVILDAVSKSG